MPHFVKYTDKDGVKLSGKPAVWALWREVSTKAAEEVDLRSIEQLNIWSHLLSAEAKTQLAALSEKARAHHKDSNKKREADLSTCKALGLG